MYSIVVDCMGSDKGSKVAVEGIKMFLSRHKDVKLYAFGRKEELEELSNINEVEIIDTPDIMPMTAGAMEAMRARNTSMYKAMVSMKENGYDGIVSAGSTGAFLTLASIKLKTIEGVERACLVTAIPSLSGKKVTVLDIGANAETTAEQLVQFAKIGRIYSKIVLGVKEPEVCLLSNGAEDEKGAPEVKQANKLLREANYPWFKGNIEGREVVKGELDVLVTGGFAGNVFLKTFEGAAKMFSKLMKDAFMMNLSTKIGYVFAKKGFDDLKEKMNYDKVGGAMFIGVNGVVVKGHGSSNGEAFSYAIEVCYDMVKNRVVELVREEVQKDA